MDPAAGWSVSQSVEEEVKVVFVEGKQSSFCLIVCVKVPFVEIFRQVFVL